jgi:hypothetical protein
MPKLALAVVVAVGLGLVAAPSTAVARTERTVSYPIARVWPTAVRFLRIDEGLEIVDKDADAGYVLFELGDKAKGRSYRGSLELIATTDHNGRSVVRLVLSIDGRPDYTEAGLLDRMLAKLGREYGDQPSGEPPPADEAPAPAKPAPPKKK